ncbi:MAG: hypothetical protein DLM50_05635 [Candidatus Meridianibacter frigidus]|nr:MAG: hypothetical protein DLM50_05635 [Candidatus Eremiobacteraeota bacterium]
MRSLAFSAACRGIEGYIVRVAADSSPGTTGCAIIGLPDRVLAEARDRVKAAAIFNSGFGYPAGRLLVNLSPADVQPKAEGISLRAPASPIRKKIRSGFLARTVCR